MPFAQIGCIKKTPAPFKEDNYFKYEVKAENYYGGQFDTGIYRIEKGTKSRYKIRYISQAEGEAGVGLSYEITLEVDAIGIIRAYIFLESRRKSWYYIYG